MASVKTHYDNLLAHHYSWLWGGFEVNASENKDFFSTHSIIPRASGLAVDLGCGSGFQAIPLAEVGFSVTAIDLSQPLLDELAAHGASLDVRPVNGDILDLESHCPAPLELAVCMGDTLTHLSSRDDVRKMFQIVFKTLQQSGMFVVNYRDLTFELTGLDRFLPVRSDDDAIFTCFLEYQEDTVTVHDLVNERIDGVWTLNKSCYTKLRLPLGWVVEALEETGFSLIFQDIDMGLATLIARKG